MRPSSGFSRNIKQITPDNLEQSLDRIKHATPEINELRAAIDDLRTRLKNAQAEIISRTRLATLGQIAANMTHEILKTPWRRFPGQWNI